MTKFSKPRADATGKWHRQPHTGVGSVDRHSQGEWQIDVSHRRVGTAIKRDVFGVKIRRSSPAHEEFLSGFSSRQAAMAAAQKRIDMLTYMAQRAKLRRVTRTRAD